MLIKKIMLATLAAFVIITPIACFTNLLGKITQLATSGLATFTETSTSNPESSSSIIITVLVFAGPILIVFFLFWHLWLQRNKAEEMLVVVFRASEIHAWLREWAESEDNDLPEDLRYIHSQAGKIFRKLDRIVSMENRDNWRWWYSLYLSFSYFLNASSIQSFLEVKVEPPPELWPTPDEALDGLDRNDYRLLENATVFSDEFTRGARASTGLRFLLHTVVGATMGFILSLIIGGAFVLALIQNLGSWIGAVLLSLTFSLVVGWLAGNCWHWIYRIRGKISQQGKTASHENVAVAVKT